MFWENGFEVHVSGWMMVFPRWLRVCLLGLVLIMPTSNSSSTTSSPLEHVARKDHPASLAKGVQLGMNLPLMCKEGKLWRNGTRLCCGQTKCDSASRCCGTFECKVRGSIPCFMSHVNMPPVSAVVPSFDRPENLPRVIHHLLRLEPFRRPGSEVVISHASKKSWSQRKAIDAAVRAKLDANRRKVDKPMRLVVHRDDSAHNTEAYTALRYGAASHVNNDVVLHLDDDLLPSGGLVATMAHFIAMEPGFPLYENRTVPNMYGPAVYQRVCDLAGYSTGGSGRQSQAVLTNLAASSRYLNRAYWNNFEDDYRGIIKKTKGNGEDLTFFTFLRRQGGGSYYVGACSEDLSTGQCQRESGVHIPVTINDGMKTSTDSKKGFHARALHFLQRQSLCVCGSAGLIGDELYRCVVNQADRDVKYLPRDKAEAAWALRTSIRVIEKRNALARQLISFGKIKPLLVQIITTGGITWRSEISHIFMELGCKCDHAPAACLNYY